MTHNELGGSAEHHHPQRAYSSEHLLGHHSIDLCLSVSAAGGDPNRPEQYDSLSFKA
jgi:hypothetical protein